MPLPPISLSPLCERDAVSDDVVAMVVEASADPAIQAHNYLPPGMGPAEARAYCASRVGVVLRIDGRPAGLAVALPDPNPGEGVAVPPGAAELDVCILAPYRGQVIRWFPLITRWMAERFDHLIGVVYETHTTASSLLRFAGFQRAGTSYWESGGVGGVCEVFVRDLRPLRTAPPRHLNSALPSLTHA